MKLQHLQEARHIANIHPVLKWIEHAISFARVNSLLSVHVKDPEDTIEAISKKYGPVLAIGPDWSEWNINTDRGQLYHLEVRDRAEGAQVNLQRVL